MRTLRRAWSRFVGMFTGRRRDAAMADEMDAHLAMLAEDNVRQGMSPDEARRAAVLTFGSLEAAKESLRDQRGIPLVENIWQDARYAVRTLARNRGFTAAAVLTLALGIGVNSAIFSVMNAVLLRPLPYPGADRLVMVWETLDLDPNQFPDPDKVRAMKHWPIDDTAFDRWNQRNQSFEVMAGFSPWTFSLTGEGEPERLKGAMVTPGFFALVGAQPLLGRGFLPEEDRPGSDRVVLLSHRLWMRRLGGTPAGLGSKVVVDGYPHTVVGILAPEFRLSLPTAEGEADILVPSVHQRTLGRRYSISTVGARLKPGVSMAQAQAELTAILRGLAAEFPRLYRKAGVDLVPMVQEMSSRVRLALLVLPGASGCVLLIVCANMANLLLVRAMARRRETGIRTALGATRRRLIQQALVEGVLLALFGGALGVVLAEWGVKALIAAVPAGLLPRAQEIGIDGRVLAFGLLASLATGLAIAAIPAWYGSRSSRQGQLHDELKAGNRSSGTGVGRRIRGLLVVSEIAATPVLVVGAGLLIRSFARLTSVDLGFQPDHVLTLGVPLPASKYGSPPTQTAFADAAMERVRALPGVQSAAITSSLPIAPEITASWGVELEGRPKGQEEASVYLRSVTPGYFQAMGITLRKGRLFTPADSIGSAVIVNQAMVRRYWAGVSDGSREPLGRRVRVDKKWYTIAGVVSDVKHDGPDRETSSELYVPFNARPFPHISLVVRVAGDPMRIVPAVRAAIWAIDRDQPIQHLQTLDRVVSDSVATPRFRMLLLGLFAVLALAVATVGVYGVIAYGVLERTREIGIRMALGAAWFEVLCMVLGEGLILAATGIVIGLAAAVGVTRVLRSFLYGTEPTDIWTFAFAALALFAIATAASYLPARRATLVDPIVALRCE